MTACAQCETAHKETIHHFLTMRELNRSRIPLSTPFLSVWTVREGLYRVVSLCFSRRFALQRSALYRAPLGMSNIFFILFSFFFNIQKRPVFIDVFEGQNSERCATVRLKIRKTGPPTPSGRGFLGIPRDSSASRLPKSSKTLGNIDLLRLECSHHRLAGNRFAEDNKSIISIY